MSRQARYGFNPLSRFVKALPQVDCLEPQINELYWSYIEQNQKDPKQMARLYPFSGNLQMKPAASGLRTSAKATSVQKMLVISCSDYQPVHSNPVSYWLDQARNIQSFGNSVPAFSKDNPDTQLFETMLLSLNMKDIVILGHTGCAAMQCVLTGSLCSEDSSHAKRHRAMELTQAYYGNLSADAQAEVLVQENVLNQMENLLSYPRLAQAVEQKKLLLHAWIFESETGKFYIYDATTGQFEEYAANRDIAIGM